MTHIPPTPRISRRATGIALALLFTLTAPGALSAAGGRDVVFKTQWKDRDLVIDGRNGDWQGALGYLNDPPVMLGFLNDDNAIYICLSTNLPAVREGMLRRGVTVWIDPKGGKRKTLGIRLVRSAPAEGPGDGRRGGPPKGAEQKTGEPPAPPEGAFERDGSAPPARLMVRLPGRDEWTPIEGGAGGIEAAVEESNGLAVFEMTVPLKSGPEAPVAIGAKPGTAISMSFETPKPERPRGRPEGQSGDRTGGRGVRGGINGPPGNGMEGPGGFGPGMEDPFKNAEGLKLRVEMKLASR
ncbi:MAG TPA: hypothetical protein VHP61_04535 [Acidobacteriota bacterium]|nr:hypothetical protein [Acidobacteriota bacterium]